MKPSIHDYATAFYQLVESRPEKSRSITERFLKQLRLHRHQSWLPLIMKEMERVEAEANSQTIVTVETAQPLGAAERQELTGLLADRLNKTGAIRLQEVVRPELIGGLRILIDDQIIDGSILNKLKTFRQSLGR